MRISYIYIFFLLLMSSIYINAQSFFPVKINDKWGLIDAQGALVVQPNYEAIGEFKHFGYAVMQRDNGVGLLDKQGKEVIAPDFDDIKVLSPTLIAVMKQKNWSVVNTSGMTVLPTGYERVRVYNSNYLAYMRNGKWGVIDIKGREITQPIYDDIQLFEDNYWLTTQAQKQGLLRADGLQILSTEYDDIRVYNTNLFFFKKDKLWGLQASNQAQIFGFDYYNPISDGFIHLKKGSNQQLYSVSRNAIISQGVYDVFLPFSEQHILAKKRQLLALIDYQGNTILSPYYNEIQTFGNIGFRVNINGKWGVVQPNDEVIINYNYDYIAPLKNNVSIIKKDGQLGLINKQGEEIITPSFTKIEIQGQRAYAYLNKKLTLFNFDENGELLDENKFSKHFTITVKNKPTPTRISTIKETSYVLSNFEWFYSPKVNKWGLRRLSDGGIQIEPTFDNIQIEQELGLTIVGVEGSNNLDFDRTTYRFSEVYGLVNNKVGLLVKDLNLLDIRLSDFDEGLPAARCIFVSGKHGLINLIGKVIAKDYAFIGDFEEGLARMSTKGRLSGSILEQKKGLGNISVYLNKHKAPSTMTDFTSHDRSFDKEAQLTCEECLWGYIDTLGQQTIVPQFQFAKDIINGVGIVNFEGKWGMIAKNSTQPLLPCEFDNVQFLPNTDNTILQVYKNQEKYGLIDTTGHLCVHLQYDDISSFSEGRLAVKRNGLWGFTDKNGNEIITCQYREVNNFSKGIASVKLGNKWGFIDLNGKVLIDYQYSRAGSFEQGLAPIYLNGGYGYINSKNELRIPTEYSGAEDFENGVARITKDFKQGIIDTLGNYILRPKYLSISKFNKYGLAIVRYGSERIRSGVIDKTGKMCAEGFLSIMPFKEGRAAVRYKNGYGFINTSGKLIINAKYSKVGSFANGRAMVQKERQCGYIDLYGKEVIPCKYSKCLDFNEGRAIVYKGYRKGGLIDIDGKVLIKPSVSRLYDFNNGRGLVRNKDQNFIYITDQNRLYDGSYEDAKKFTHGVAAVKVNNKWGIINQNGIEVIPPKYDKIEPFENGYARVRIKGFSGLTNLKGEIIMDANYEYITYAGQGIFRVEKGDKVGYFDMSGEWIWELSE